MGGSRERKLSGDEGRQGYRAWGAKCFAGECGLCNDDSTSELEVARLRKSIIVAENNRIRRKSLRSLRPTSSAEV